MYMTFLLNVIQRTTVSSMRSNAEDDDVTCTVCFNETAGRIYAQAFVD